MDVSSIESNLKELIINVEKHKKLETGIILIKYKVLN